MIAELLEKYYEEFKGLPNEYPIVRMAQKDDAFPIVVLDILYSREYDFSIEKSNVLKIADIIVSPPDSGIDMVIEKDKGDEFEYDFIQVKYSDLSDVDIKACFNAMKRTIDDFFRNPEELSPNLIKVLQKTQFDESAKGRSSYFVVHRGSKNTCSGIKDDEHVVCLDELRRINDSNQFEIPKVRYEELKSDYVNNFSIYSDNAYLINVRGYELAELSNKYNNTEKGRNILFGQNLRDSLDSKSKTYKAMEKTIDEEPEQFWYYNNGITIVADDVDFIGEDGEEINGKCSANKKVDRIILKSFSIINGAQTTSSLGKYLKEADDREVAIAKLKKVFVFARILRVVDEDSGNKIAIYNNTQNPITTRDMVSNNREQKLLEERLLKDSPHIYMETRRGTHLPAQPQILKHRRTSNEELAQLSYAGFLLKPFIAKDKKKSLFNKDYSHDDYIVNEFYDTIFRYDANDPGNNGLLFKKANDEIDELLFVKCLYKESNKYIKQVNNKRIDAQKLKLEDAEESTKETYENSIRMFKRNIEISNISLFYVMAYYFYVKSFVQKHGFTLNIERYYEDKIFKENLIKRFSELFLMPTISTINDFSADYSSASSWIRSSKSQEKFLNEIANKCGNDLDLEDKILEFMKSFSE